MEVYSILILFSIFHNVKGKVITPCPCKYDHIGRIADCSSLRLTSVIEIIKCVPNTTEDLIISNNELTSIPAGTFLRLPLLRSLNLDHNKFEKLTNDTFLGLSKLDTLVLSHNALKHYDSFPAGLFKPLHNLRRLSLQGNCNIRAYQCFYPDKALSFAPTLQYLHLDGIPNTNLGLGFSYLKQLDYLYFSDDNGFCYLPTLTEATFSVLKNSHISHLKIESCDIVNLTPNVFRWMHNLTTLIITGCQKLCSDSIENATIGLNETQILTIRFNYWCSHPPYFPLLSKNNFQSLTSTSLKHLDLGWNNIYYIDPSVIENLPLSIEYISLKENSITTAMFLEKMVRLVNLRTFDGSYQNHFQLSVNLNKQIKQKSVISSQNVYLPSSNSKAIYNQSNSENLFEDLVYLPRNLDTLYINNIKLGYPVPSLRFAQNKLRYLRASSCMLTAFLGPWYGLHDLKYMDLSHNRFGYIHPLSFIDAMNLSVLLLQQNEIGKSILQDKNGKTFSSLNKLTQLDLSSNEIKDLPYHIFKEQINLKNLSLANNGLKNISFMMTSMTNLRFLNLSGNEIEYMSEQNMIFLDRIARNVEFFLDLSENNLACTCNNFKFIDWLAKTNINIIRKDKLTCLYINQTFISLSQLPVIRENLKYECTSWIVVTSCVIGFIFLLLILSLIALLYYKRWQLRYLWYIGRLKMDPYNYPDDQEQPLLQIDAYISYDLHYDVTDEMSLHRIIADRLYPYFQQRGYALKIREEFDGYERLYKVIPETVRKSRKVVVFLTPTFCDDYWNIFEFNLAAYEGIYKTRDVIIPVLLGDVSEKNFTPEIRSFVKTKLKSNEVIRYPLSDRDNNSFMEQLESLIRH